jgi:protein-L-isoaspartate(D-aspartate) O-methyltransferase
VTGRLFFGRGGPAPGRSRLIEAIRDRGIEDLEILELFDRVPRDRFLPPEVAGRAWDDTPVPIGWGQTASQPSLQALYLRTLGIQPDDRVLEIGTGSGFLTALLSQQAARVYSIDRIRELSRRAGIALEELGIRNVALLVGDGTIGWRKFAPFDVIVVSAGAPSIPHSLIEQLGPGGRMLIPVGDRNSQELVLVRRMEDESISQEVVAPECVFVPLLGRFAWQEDGAEPRDEGARG